MSLYQSYYLIPFKILIEGLSSKRVLSATQDRSGFVWIGTDEGLNRFDGYLNKTTGQMHKENTLSGNKFGLVI